MQASSPSGATCTTRSSAIRSSASARCRACSNSRPPVPTAIRRCPRSCGSIRRAAEPPSRRGDRRNSSAILPSCTVMVRYHATWILPISEPPIRDGWVAVERGRVVAYGALGPAGRRGLADGAREVDLGNVAVLPGLVNAHTHLELSYLRDEVPPASEFVTWIRGVINARRRRPDPDSAEILDAVARALDEAVAYGTAVIGDVGNTLVTFGPLARSPLAGVMFYELIRFNTSD